MFIKKIDMLNYKIGSFSSFITDIEKLLKDKYNMSDGEITEYLEELDKATCAAVTNKNGYFVGFIGTKNTDLEKEKTDIIFETIEDSGVDTKKVLETYKMYLKNSININKYNEQRKKEKTVILKSKNVILDTDEEVIAEYKKKYPNMPELSLSASLYNDSRIGIIGLSNLSRSDKSANLNIYLNDDSKTYDSEYLARMINEYIDYLHKRNIWNINCEIGANQTTLIDALNQSNMNYYGMIPFADIDGAYIGNKELYQHIPRMIRRDYKPYGSEIYVARSIFKTENTEMQEMIPLYNNYKMYRTDILVEDSREENPLLQSSICGLALAMSDRRKFTIPLGRDKYFPTLKDEDYGLDNFMRKTSYIVLNGNNEFAGFLNILNSECEHCEIEVAVIPEEQEEGLGKEISEIFCQELFKIGYASITARVLDFNVRGNLLFNRIATPNGKRIQSYYTNGKLCDMNIYTKLNPLVEKVKIK